VGLFGTCNDYLNLCFSNLDASVNWKTDVLCKESYNALVSPVAFIRKVSNKMKYNE